LNKSGLLKKNFLLFVLVFSSIIVKAQGDYNFMPMGIGGGAGIIRGYTNVAKQNNTIAANINFTYYVSPYLPITLEVQKGTLSGGSTETDQYKRQYSNSYLGLYLHGDLQLGQVIDYYYSGINEILKNVYFGSGVGFVNDNVNNQRTNLVATSQYPVGKWNEAIGENPMAADGIMDRLTAVAHRIELKGESLRKKGDTVSACFLLLYTKYH